MITNIEQTIREYLPWIVHMSLATCADNKPWVCEVHYVYDDDLNLYFRSKIDRRHSQEIQQNSYVAWNMIEQHARVDKPRWVYFEWICKMMLGVNNSSLVYQLFNQRFGLGEEILEDMEEEGGHQFYKISVSNFALFDKRESNPSQKYELEWWR